MTTTQPCSHSRWSSSYEARFLGQRCLGCGTNLAVRVGVVMVVTVAPGGDEWIGKDLEGIGRGVIEILSRHLTGGTEGNHEESQVARGAAEIWTEYLPNVNLESYCCGNLLSAVTTMITGLYVTQCSLVDIYLENAGKVGQSGRRHMPEEKWFRAGYDRYEARCQCEQSSQCGMSRCQLGDQPLRPKPAYVGPQRAVSTLPPVLTFSGALWGTSRSVEW
jgi:hypothetical protein